MKDNKPTAEVALYCLAFLLALVMRLYQLEAAALSEVEAGWAVQALGLARGGAVTLGPQPLYVQLTSLLFPPSKIPITLPAFSPLWWAVCSSGCRSVFDA